MAEYCPSCGAQVLYAGARYCQRCGRPLKIPAGGSSSAHASPASPPDASASPDAARFNPHAPTSPVPYDSTSAGTISPPALSPTDDTVTASARARSARRPLWLVAGLTFMTFGLYGIYWLGKSWGEMKDEVNDPGMDPLGHALAMVVPIYNLFRLHAHFRVINQLLARTGSTVRVQPWFPIGFVFVGPFMVLLLIALVATIVTAVTSSGLATLIGIFLYGVFLCSTPLFIVLYGQYGLNTYWDARTSVPVRYRIGLGQWLLLFGGLVLWLWISASLIAQATETAISRV